MLLLNGVAIEAHCKKKGIVKRKETINERQELFMMMRPSYDELLKKVDNSPFTLVTLAMKRAKQLNTGAVKLLETNSSKPVTIALEEIAAGKIIPRNTQKPAEKQVTE